MASLQDPKVTTSVPNPEAKHPLPGNPAARHRPITFLDLPYEVRKTVYSFIPLSLPASVHAPYSLYQKEFRECWFNRLTDPVSRVSRQLYAELRTEFYERVECHVRIEVGCCSEQQRLEGRQIFRTDSTGVAAISRFRNILLDFDIKRRASVSPDMFMITEEFLRKFVEHYPLGPRRLRIFLRSSAPFECEVTRRRISSYESDRFVKALQFMLRPLRALQGVRTCMIIWAPETTIPEDQAVANIPLILFNLERDVEDPSIGPEACLDVEETVILWRECHKLHQHIFPPWQNPHLQNEKCQDKLYGEGTELLECSLRGDMSGVIKVLAKILTITHSINGGRFCGIERRPEKALEKTSRILKFEIKVREAALRHNIPWPLQRPQ
ncbi:MAG: hypothetical protein M1820_004288 [Bogoriella megaspora]|nr:MAG: hypothetical protein M1820_004288 [Bogoriella megaspora]